MSAKTTIVVLLFLTCWLLLAQNSLGQGSVDMDYQKFQETFKKEISNDTIKLIDPVLHPASIPAIFYEIPPGTEDKIYSIGISDPGMGIGKDALSLALLRGKMIMSMLLYPQVGIITDSYTNEEDNNSGFSTRYADFYKIESELLFDSTSFKIEAYNVSSFGELIVLLSYVRPQKPVGEIISSEAGIYQNERQKQVRFDSEGKFDMIATEKSNNIVTTSTSYQVTLLNSSADIQTILNQKPIDFPYRNYRYVSDSIMGSEDFVGSKLTFGLWKSFSECLLSEICNLSQNSDVKIKQLDDSYNSGKQSLSRELLKSQFRFELLYIQIYNNCLSVKLNTIK